jgi:Fe-S-cluster-containing dehydrogenase component
VLTFEVGEGAAGRTVHFPKSCLHCDNASCVTACPTGASYKRAEDGIVLIDADKCIGCKLCAWACPYGAREYDEAAGVMRKCTLCVDRIYDEKLPEREREPMCVAACPARARIFGDFADPGSEASRIAAERGGVALLAELGAGPTYLYLPPRRRPSEPATRLTPQPGGALAWLSRVLGD